MKKADEYMERFEGIKLRDIISDPNIQQDVIFEMFKELALEVQEIMNKDVAFYSIVKEVNAKSNAIAQRLKKKYGVSVLRKNSFIHFLEISMPDVYALIKK